MKVVCDMLVLSRRPDESVEFPGLGVSVKVLSVRNGSCRLGVDAPADVAVLRDELLADSKEDEPAYGLRFLPAALRHDLKNEVNAISLGLGVVLDQVRGGQTEDAVEVLEELIAQAETIRNHCSAE